MASNGGNVNLNAVKELESSLLKVSENLATLHLEVERAVQTAGQGWKDEVYERFVKDINLYQQMLEYLSKGYKGIAEVKLHRVVEILERMEHLDRGR